jgi:phosphatidylinositol phospholipase C epsilon
MSVFTDTAMQLNCAMFEQTGRSGYVVKPRVMWDKKHPMYGKFNPWEKDYEDLQATTLTVHVGVFRCNKYQYREYLMAIM